MVADGDSVVAVPFFDFREVERPVISIVALRRLCDVLLQCLASIHAQRTRVPFEVIFVLNGAEDHVRRAVRSNVSGARVIDAEYNLGFGGGRNRGASVAQGEHLLFLSDDTDLVQACVGALAASAKRTPKEGGRFAHSFSTSTGQSRRRILGFSPRPIPFRSDPD